MQWLHLRNELLYLKITKTLFVGFVKNLAIRCFVAIYGLNSGFNNFNGNEIKLHPMNIVWGKLNYVSLMSYHGYLSIIYRKMSINLHNVEIIFISQTNFYDRLRLWIRR